MKEQKESVGLYGVLNDVRTCYATTQRVQVQEVIIDIMARDFITFLDI